MFNQSEPVIRRLGNRPLRPDPSIFLWGPEFLERKTRFEGSRTNAHDTPTEIYHNYKRLYLSSVCLKSKEVQFNSAESNTVRDTLGTVRVKFRLNGGRA